MNLSRLWQNIKQRWSVAATWGTSPAERELDFECDRALTRPNGFYWRGLTIEADPGLIYSWLCQMRLAPYSYDWIDNFGRRSPQQRSPGLDRLALGQRMMYIFKVVHFRPGEELTLATGQSGLARFLTGAGAITYRILPLAEQPDAFRLVGKLAMTYPRGPVGWFSRVVLPWGDLVMMRRQLLNFKRLAERDQQNKRAISNV